MSDTVFVDTQRAVVKPFARDDHERAKWLKAWADDTLARITFRGPCIVSLPFLMVGRITDDRFITVVPYDPLEETLIADLGEGGILQAPLFVPREDCQPVENEDE